MPIKWGPDQDQRLLLVVNDIVKIDCAKAAAKWQEKYGEPAPTAKAISEHLAKVKRNGGGASNGHGTPSGGARQTPGTATPKKGKATPKRGSVFDTPNTSGKRKRANVSDEDDSEDEREMMKDQLGRRSPLSRRSKSVQRSYVQKDEEDQAHDEDEDDTKAEAGIFNSPLDGCASFDGAAEAGGGSGVDSAAESTQLSLPKAAVNGKLSSAMNRANILGSTENGTLAKEARKVFDDSADESDVSIYQPGYGL